MHTHEVDGYFDEQDYANYSLLKVIPGFRVTSTQAKRRRIDHLQHAGSDHQQIRSCGTRSRKPSTSRT